MVSGVEPPWTHTVSIYGPFATVLQSLTSHLGGANLRETVWWWQVLVVLAWLGVRLVLQILVIVWLVGCAGWAIQVLWRV